MHSKTIVRTVRHFIEALEARIAPATFVWRGGSSGNWSDASKWSNSVGGINNGVPDDDTDVANFDAASGSPTVRLDNNFTIQQLNFTETASPLIAPTILGSPLSLNFDRVGSPAVISSTGTGNPVIAAKLVALAGFGVNITVSGSNPLVLNGPLSEASGYFNKNGSGAAIFGGAAQNTFSHANGLQVSFGTLQLSKDAGAIPMTGNITINGGTLRITQDPTTANEEIDNNSTVTINGSGIFRIDAPLGETVGRVAGSGIIDLQGNRLSVANTSVFGGIFPSGGTIGGVSASGDQRLELSGTQTLGFNFNVDGLVRMLPGSNFSTSNFTLQQNSGAQSILDGDGTVGSVSGGTVSGDTFITPGTLGVGGKISVASLAPGATNLDVGFTVAGAGGAGVAAGHDQIVVRAGGTVNLTGGSLSASFASFTPSVGQTFTLIDNQGTAPIAGTLTNLSGGAPLPEGTTVQSFSGGNVVVRISYTGGDGNDLVYNVVDANGNGAPVTFSPGGTPGIGTQTQTTALTANQPLTFIFDVNGAGAGTGHDQIVVSGAGAIPVNAGDTGTINFPATAPAAGSVFRLIDVQNTSTIAPIPGLAAGQVRDYGTVKLNLSYTGGDGNDVVLTAVGSGQVVSVGAPTFSPDGRRAVFTDMDGDIVTVKTDKGAFSAANFAMVNFSGASGAVLQTLDLSKANFGKQFKNATIKVKVAQAGAGDGFVNIGRINAKGLDLVSVSVAGELEQIDVGNADPATPGLGTLKAITMGVNGLSPLFGFASDPAGGLTSKIIGKLGTLQVTKGTSAFTGQSGIVGAFIDVTGGATEKLGKISAIAIDQLTGRDDAPTVFNTAGVVTFASGTIRASGAIVTASVTGGVTGAAGDYSGDLWSRRAIGSVTVGGSVTGAGGLDSGAIFVGSPDGGSTAFGRTMGAVAIGGSLVGGAGEFSGTLYADGGLGAVSIAGSVLGGTQGTTGAIVTLGGIASVTIGGTLTGAAMQYSGSIVAFGGDVGPVTVTQALVTGSSAFGFNGIFVNGNLASVTTGALNATGSGSGAIVALGGIGTVSVTGSATNWNIAAGYDTEFAQDVDGRDADGNPTDNASYNPDATIGTVTIGGSLTGGSITAGTLFGADGIPGGAGDIHMPGDTAPAAIASIASIVVAGQAANAVFEAQQISAVQIQGILAPLTAGIDLLTVGTNSSLKEL